jgi:hypothetical protein
MTGSRLLPNRAVGSSKPMYAREPDPCIKRSALVRLLELHGPENERINERLLEWSRKATSFEIGEKDNPLAQIGIGSQADDELVDSLEVFFHKVEHHIGLSEDDIADRLEHANPDLRPEDLDEDARPQLAGLRIAVCDD